MSQHGGTARITVTGDSDLDAAAAQVRRFLSLDVDARIRPAVAAARRHGVLAPRTEGPLGEAAVRAAFPRIDTGPPPRCGLLGPSQRMSQPVARDREW